MKINRSKRWIMPIAAMLVVLMAFAISGCGSSSSGSMPGPAITHTEKVSYIGDISGTLADEIEATFVNRVSYDGSSTDAPIVIAAQSVPLLSSTQQEGIRNTFSNLQPIVLVQCSAAEINALLGILGLEQNYTLPEGLPADKQYTELFAVDQEADGYIFTWSMYPSDDGLSPSADAGAPLPTPYTDNTDYQFRRTDIFHSFIDKDGNRVTAEVKAARNEAIQAFTTGAAADNTELTQLAKGFVVTKNFNDHGNNYQITYYIYSCHSFNDADATDYDWFYVRQEGMNNASGAYGGVTAWYGGGPSDEVHYYIGNYKMNNWMDGLTSSVSGVSLMKADPQNANNVTSVTSGVNWNIGGSIGFQGTNATGSLNAGVTITNSTTVSVNDCQIFNNSGNSVNNANWRYEFKKPAQTVYFGYTGLSEPPILSRSNFQPVNQWIWKFSPAVRDANKNWFYSQFDVDLIWSVGGQSYAWWIADPAKHYTYGGGSWKFQIPLSFPPLLVATHNVDFTAAGQYKALDIAVSRNWTASSNQSWCQVAPASGTGSDLHLTITVDPNSTGARRTATITYTTTDGKGSDTTIVSQSQY